ncbi:hypothetical protein RJT34_25765 [Clitoria ternatea]|uniref:Secreted protein n=1 Tax=Clitoria ternatea TaxID=43366 RepID=A0AAN9FYB7_CLITE
MYDGGYVLLLLILLVLHNRVHKSHVNQEPYTNIYIHVGMSEQKIGKLLLCFFAWHNHQMNRAVDSVSISQKAGKVMFLLVGDHAVVVFYHFLISTLASKTWQNPACLIGLSRS